MERNSHSRTLPKSVQPLFRWAGSKRKLLPTLLPHCPSKFNKYIEPFAGSACLFFLLQPEHAVLGDFNPQLIDTYRTVARAPHAVAAKLTTMLVSHEYYYELRAQNPTALRSLERAARFVYLNRFCFNGVFRTNQRGEFNVPRGTKTGQLPTATDLRACAQILRSATLIAGDFERTLEGVDRGDFVYLDPPYSSSAERNRGEYGYGAFSSDDLGRLEESLRRIDRLKATFVLSYRCSKMVRARFSEWHQRTLTVRRHVAGFSEDRRDVREMLISNRPLELRSR
jgi:DNA adenine methylase